MDMELGKSTYPSKPDYVKDCLEQHPHTEAKYLNGRWYLYERSSKYNKEKKRSDKKSGAYLGRILENGTLKGKCAKKVSRRLNDVVEVGMTRYLFERTSHMRECLEKYFPDIWAQIYTVSLLRAEFDGRFRRLESHYEDSVLQYLYPDVALSKPAITGFLDDLGRRRGAIREFMLEDVRSMDNVLLIDGHRILSFSASVESAEFGYDSKCRHKKQINVIYVFSLGEGTGSPDYYKYFSGGTADVSAFEDVVKELKGAGTSCTVVADKGFGSSDNYNMLEGSSLDYIIPLKRGNAYVKGRVPQTPQEYDGFFTYNGRAVHFNTYGGYEGSTIYLFRDADLYNDELNTLIKAAERKNNARESRKANEEKRREKGAKGKLTDEELAGLIPVSNREMFENREEMGTITIKTNKMDLNGMQVYCMYKQRQKIEQFFKTYGETLDFEASYMRSDYSMEAWLFLNHLSSRMAISAIEEISSIGKAKEISYEDLRSTLKKIKAYREETEWQVVPIKKAVERLCTQLGFDTGDISFMINGET